MELADLAFSNIPGHLRPLNILRDLSAVADLIELCFASTLGVDGHSFLEQMRRNARDSHFLNWAPGVIDSVSLPLSGFVWENDGKIIGNVSLIPYRRDGRRITLIANVATHPDYRGQGIGRTLTERALARARERSSETWLQVRADNPAAIHIYQQIGFQERARRTHWLAQPDTPAPQASAHPNVQLRPRLPADWEQQRAWLVRANPPETGWFAPMPDTTALGPQWWGGLYRLFNDINIEHRAAVMDNNTLAGLLTVQETAFQRHQVWLALPPHPREEVICALLLDVRRNSNYAHHFSLEYPAGSADAGILAAGFVATRTLLWMKAA